MSVFATMAGDRFEELAAELAARPVPEAPASLPSTAASALDERVTVVDADGPVECKRLLREWNMGEDGAQAVALQLQDLFHELDLERVRQPLVVTHQLTITQEAQHLIAVRTSGRVEADAETLTFLPAPVADDQHGGYLGGGSGFISGYPARRGGRKRNLLAVGRRVRDLIRWRRVSGT
jgi:hypothetical protein